MSVCACVHCSVKFGSSALRVSLCILLGVAVQSVLRFSISIMANLRVTMVAFLREVDARAEEPDLETVRAKLELSGRCFSSRVCVCVHVGQPPVRQASLRPSRWRTVMTRPCKTIQNPLSWGARCRALREGRFGWQRRGFRMKRAWCVCCVKHVLCCRHGCVLVVLL